MSRLFDMARMTVAAAPGTGSIVLGAAAVADGITYLTFAQAGALDGAVLPYRITDGVAWEVGHGTYSAAGPGLTRSVLFSSNGNAAIDASANALVSVTVLAQDLIQGIELTGNTAGASSIAFSPDLVFSGGTGVTLSGVSNSIVISAGGGGGGSSSYYAAGNTTGATSSLSASGSLTIIGAGNAEVGFSAGSLVISATSSSAAQSVQTLGLFAVGNTVGSTSSETVDARTVSFDGAGIASVGFSGGSIIVSATAASQTAPTLSLFAVGNTTTSTSSGVIAPGALSFDGAGIVSVGVSGSSIVISATSAATSQSAQTLGLFAVGNTTGSTSSETLDARTISFDGAGIASVGFSAGSIIVSATAPAQTAPTLSVFAVGNTTTSTSSGVIAPGALSFDGAGIVSVGVSGSSIVISATSAATSQSAQTLGLFAVGNTTGSTSSETVDARTISFDGAGIASVGFSGGSVIFSVAPGAQSVQTLGLFAVGNTTGSTSSETLDARTISFDGAGIASVGFSAGSIIVSASSAASQGGLTFAALGNTTGATSSSSTSLPAALSFSGAGEVSVGYSSSTIIISAPRQSLFAVGNTTSSLSSGIQAGGSLSFDGAGIVSVGISNSSVVISAPSPPAQTAPSLSLFAVGNTTTSTSSGVIGAGSLSFDGAGLVSIGISGSSIVISATSGATSQSAQTLGLFAVGNTAGSTSSETVDARTISFDGAGIASVGFSGGSVIVSVAPGAQTVQTLGLFAVGNTTGTTSSETLDARTISFDGAGLASVGFSAGSIIVSATAPAQTAPTLSLFAVGNTTTSTSSGVIAAGAISFDGAGLVSVGISGSSVVISATSGATSQSAQTLGLFAVGNTTGSTSSETVDARTISFDGAGLASVGFSGGSIIVSATAPAQTAPTLSVYAVGNTTTSTSSGSIAAGSLSFDGAGIVSVGISGSSVVISAPTPAGSGTAESRFALGNTTGATSSTVGTLGSLSLSGAGGVSVGFSTTAVNAGVIVVSGATTSASGTAESRSASGNSFGQSSSAVGTLGSLVVSATGGISAGFSTAANSAVLMLSVAPPVASGTADSMAALGNTTGASSSAVGTLASLSLSGAGIVSVGFNTAANSGVWIVSASTAATNPLLSLYAVGNTTTSTSSGVNAAGSLSFDGAGIVSVGISGSSVVISAPSPAASGVVQNEYAIGNTTAASSSTTQSLSSVSISGAGIVSVGYSTTAAGAGALVISASTAATNPLLSLYAVGNTTTSTSSGLNAAGSLSFDGAGIVSVGISGSSIVISAPSPAASATVQSQYAIGNTTAASSSSTQSLTSLSFSGAGGVSVGFSTTAAGAGAIVISGATTAASGTAENLFASGNTTGATSSSVFTLTNKTISGAGIVSVGFSTTGAGAGQIIISATTAAQSVQTLGLFAVGNTTGTISSETIDARTISFDGAGGASVGFSAGSIIVSAPAAGAAALNLFAVGNTTTSASSGVIQAGALSFDGAGIISVGISNSSVVISATGGAQTAPTLSIYAVGNTTTSTSSGVIGAGSLSFDADTNGALSVGISGSSVVLSAPSISSLVGNVGISLSTTSNTISIFTTGGSISYLEPVALQATTTQALPVGTMMVAPLEIQAAGGLVMNQARFLASRAVVNPIVTATSRGTATTQSATASWGSTQSLVLYSRQGDGSSNSFTTWSSTTATWGVFYTVSNSMTGSSNTVSQTIRYQWPQGTSSLLSSSMSLTFSSASASWSSQAANASTSNFSAWFVHAIPLVATLAPGEYLVGIMGATATAGTGAASLSLAAGSWSGTTLVMSQSAALTFNNPGVASAAGTAAFPGVGSTSSAGSAVPVSIAWQSISSGPQVYFYAGSM